MPEYPGATPSFDSLYADHHGWLRGWLKRKLGCADHAADVAQDTFVRVLLRPDLPSLREPRAFLTTIAQGLLIDHSRRAALERAYRQALSEVPEAYHPSVETQVLMVEALLEIERLLSGLSERARRAFLLSRLDGLSHAEIAQQIGVSVSRVRQYLAQALRLCYLAQHGETP